MFFFLFMTSRFIRRMCTQKLVSTKITRTDREMIFALEYKKDENRKITVSEQNIRNGLARKYIANDDH